MNKSIISLLWFVGGMLSVLIIGKIHDRIYPKETEYNIEIYSPIKYDSNSIIQALNKHDKKLLLKAIDDINKQLKAHDFSGTCSVQISLYTGWDTHAKIYNLDTTYGEGFAVRLLNTVYNPEWKVTSNKYNAFKFIFYKTNNECNERKE